MWNLRLPLIFGFWVKLLEAAMSGRHYRKQGDAARSFRGLPSQ